MKSQFCLSHFRPPVCICRCFFSKHIGDVVSRFHLLDINLVVLYEFLSEPEELGRDVFDIIGLDKTFSNSSNASGVVFKNDCSFVPLSKPALARNYLVHAS
jgi:hypothetical protein